jgi:hypothetical protein
MEFQAGQQGRFATSAEPGKWRDVVLQRVDMSSTTENGESFIKAIGTSSQFDDQARFRLTGFACISRRQPARVVDPPAAADSIHPKKVFLSCDPHNIFIRSRP